MAQPESDSTVVKVNAYRLASARQSEFFLDAMNARLFSLEILWSTFAAVVMGVAVTSSTAADFRMDSRVFEEGQPEAKVRVITRFLEQRIYDEQMGGGTHECCVLDLDASQCTLLDLNRQVFTELSFQQIANFSALATRQARDSVPFVQFAAAPVFDRKLDPDSGTIVLSGDWMRYQASTKPAPTRRHAETYRAFADWSARLNTMRHGLPPAARLRLNEQMFVAERLPERVEKTVRLKKGKSMLLFSEHEYRWEVHPDDRSRAREIDALIQEFRRVNLESFCAS